MKLKYLLLGVTLSASAGCVAGCSTWQRVDCNDSVAMTPLMPTIERRAVFSSSDKLLEQSYNWAKAKALSYAHDSGDAVGAWYEAALPNREAFLPCATMALPPPSWKTIRRWTLHGMLHLPATVPLSSPMVRNTAPRSLPMCVAM